MPIHLDDIEVSGPNEADSVNSSISASLGAFVFSNFMADH